MDSKQNRIITKILTPALGLWLRSQVQQVKELSVRISGSDGEILRGHIPYVSIKATHVVYQGLHLSQIQLVGEGIRINLGQVLKGQPLRLLKPVPVTGELLLQQSDLNASLPSSLLSNALTELLEKLIPANDFSLTPVSWRHIGLDDAQFTLSLILATEPKPIPMVLRTSLLLVSPHELRLECPRVGRWKEWAGGDEGDEGGVSWEDLESVQLTLEPEVEIEELTLSPSQLCCRCRLKVIP